MSLPVVAVPRFITELPISKLKVSFRPFLVKEEKSLIMANESGEAKDVTNAVTQIVEACTDGVVTAKNGSMFDMQHMFLQIRAKSIGETIEFYLVCTKDGCNHKVSREINVEEFKLHETPGHTHVIDLGNGLQVEMRYPNFDMFSRLYESEEEDVIYDVVAACIGKIITPEEVVENNGEDPTEWRTFVDNLTPEQFAKLEVFFDTMPVLQYNTTYTCEACQTVNDVTIDGVRNFFG